MIYIAISRYGWGKSPDQAKAIKNCKANAPRGKRSGQIKVYVADEQVEIFGDGSWSYPQGKQPELLLIVGTEEGKRKVQGRKPAAQL